MLGKYTDLMFKFLDKGYKDVFFNELSSEYNQLIIRHDVDFDCEFAYKMAKIEYILGVRSTYFFMLSNSIYNLKGKTIDQNEFDFSSLEGKVSLIVNVACK